MSRSRASAKSAGTSFETLVTRYLAQEVDPGIERRRLSGSKDRGDFSGVHRRNHPGPRIDHRVTVEAKEYGGRVHIGPWLKEVERERTNDGALAGVVVAKRKGTTDPAEQIVIMSVKDLCALLTGSRP